MPRGHCPLSYPSLMTRGGDHKKLWCGEITKILDQISKICNFGPDKSQFCSKLRSMVCEMLISPNHKQLLCSDRHISPYLISAPAYTSYFSKKRLCPQRQVITGIFFEIEIFVLKYVLAHFESLLPKKVFSTKNFCLCHFF